LTVFEVGLVWARRLGWVDFVRREGRTYVVLKNEPPAVTEMEAAGQKTEFRGTCRG
jgi:hypothetical protein